MKVCDVCHAPATDEIIFVSDDQHVDVCETHRRMLFSVLTDTPKEKQPRKKNLAKAE